MVKPAVEQTKIHTSAGNGLSQQQPYSQSSTQKAGYLRLALVCALLLAVADVLKLLGHTVPKSLFLPVHMILEFTSIVVSYAVFTMGWYGYKQTKNSRDLFVAAVFLTAGSIDFIHTLSYKGMPAFLGTNTVGKAAAYWLLSRLVVAVGILFASFVKPNSTSRWLSPGFLVTASVGVSATALAVCTFFQWPVSDLLYNRATESLTPLKVALEWSSIVLYAAAAFVTSERRGWDGATVKLMRRALLVSMFAGIAFTLYIMPYDWINALGHGFKTFAYYIILNALFVSSLQKPYQQLSHARDELELLYADAKEHRREIERSFARIGSALSSSLNLEEALNQITDLAADMLHADCVIVASVDKTGYISVAAQRGGCHEAAKPADLAREIGAKAVGERRTVVFNDLKSAGISQCELDDPTCLRAMICAPMMYDGDVLGIITIYSHRESAFDTGDIALIEAFASHAAVAMYNAISYTRESRIADILQRSLISPAKITSDRFEIAQVYKAAMEEGMVGGDFYDAVEMQDGKVALVIGDVSGKGLKAAVNTAVARYSLRAFLAEGHSCAETMRLLNNTVCAFVGSDSFITMFLGVLDTNTGTLVYANAGHEPPVYVGNGVTEELPATGAALGLVPGSTYDQGIIELEEGSVLLLYTDGVSEARHDMEFLGTERITEKLLVCDGLGSADVAKCVYQAAVDFSGGKLRDDVAILAVRAM